jgi:hypothetical protein
MAEPGQNNKGPAPILTSGPNFILFDSTDLASDINLKDQEKMPKRVPREIWWNEGDLEVVREDGTTVLLDSSMAGQPWRCSPATVLEGNTTATFLFVTW